MPTTVSPEIAGVMKKCFVSARKSRHRYVTVEHLLLQMLAEQPVVDYLTASSINIDALRSALTRFVSGTIAQPEGMEPDNEPTREFQQTLQSAIFGAQSRGQDKVSLVDLLTEVLERRKSFLAKF